MQHIKQFILFPRFDISAILFAVGIKTKQPTLFQESVAGELAGARTRDPNIKSVVLYLLSYEFIVPIGGIPRFLVVQM